MYKLKEVADMYFLTKETSTVKFCKVNKLAKIPTKRKEDAGFDIYAVVPEGSSIIINPHETKMIPTGLKSTFDYNLVIVLKERGSTGTKGMGQRAGIIDSGYRGEWFVPITNHNDKPLIIFNDVVEVDCYDAILYPSSKAICQALVLELPWVEIEEVDDIDNDSERGIGALGSSNK